MVPLPSRSIVDCGVELTGKNAVLIEGNVYVRYFAPLTTLAYISQTWPSHNLHPILQYLKQSPILRILTTTHYTFFEEDGSLRQACLLTVPGIELGPFRLRGGVLVHSAALMKDLYR